MEKKRKEFGPYTEAMQKRLETLNRAEEIQDLVLEAVQELAGAEFAVLWGNEYPKLFNVRKEGARQISLDGKEGLLYKCFLTREPAIYNYISSEKGYIPAVDNPDGIRIKSMIMLPLTVKEEVVGVLTAYASVRRAKNFSQEDLEILMKFRSFLVDALYRILHLTGRPIPVERRRRPRGPGDDAAYRRKETRTEKVEDTGSQAMMEYLTGVVHDLRTPANNLAGFLEILEEHLEEGRLREYLHNALQSARMINDFTGEILDTIRAGKIAEQEKDLAPVQSVKFFAEIAESFCGRMYDKKIDYLIDINPQLPKEMQLHTVKLRRVLVNLLGNAVKFTPVRGRVTLSIQYDVEAKELRISVKDTGIGIPKERQKKIFAAFSQADESTRKHFGGHGVGLSVSAAFVREMGGSLQVESEPEKGSCFHFALPLHNLATEQPKMPNLRTGMRKITMLMESRNNSVARLLLQNMLRAGIDRQRIRAISKVEEIPGDTTHLIVFQHKWEHALSRMSTEMGVEILPMEEDFLSLDAREFPGITVLSQYSYFGEAFYAYLSEKTPPRVLLVEDDAISIQMLKAMLEGEYCELEIARSGDEGFRKLSETLMAERPFDLLYTDQNMPGFSGEEMLRRYRELEARQGVLTPLTAISISGDPRQKETELFDLYASKPFRKAEILQPLHAHPNHNKE